MIFTTVFFAAMVAATLLYVFGPLWRGSGHAVLPAADLSALRAEARESLRRLQELEFDFQSGKVSEEDYAESRQEAEERALHLLRRLDGFADGPDAPPSGGAPVVSPGMVVSAPGARQVEEAGDAVR